MRKILFCLLLNSVCAVGVAQFKNPFGFPLPDGVTAVDSAYIQVTYSLLSVKNPADVEHTTFEDIQTLLVGTKISKCFSQHFAQHIEQASQSRRNGARSVARNIHRGSYGYEVFGNYPQHGITTVVDLGDFPNVNYRYQESTPVFLWRLDGESVEVLKYRCQKATVRFRGRDYIAWFAPTLPIPLGPWKFGGLPGLILKISDTQNHYRWECIGIKRIERKEPIEFRSGVKFTKVSREELNRFYIRYHKDEIAFLTSLGIQMTQRTANGGEKQVFHSERELPYNPIELE